MLKFVYVFFYLLRTMGRTSMASFVLLGLLCATVAKPFGAVKAARGALAVCVVEHMQNPTDGGPRRCG